MTFVGVLCMLAGLLVLPFAVIDRSGARLGVVVIAYILHCVSSFVYFDFVQSNAADSAFYYFDEYGFAENDFAFGTQFVVLLTQTLKAWTGGTYLDLFLFFSSIGFFGIGLLFRMLEELFQSADTTQPLLPYFLLFLPGLYFWTSAIGKDAPLFFACCLSLWSLLNLNKRFWGFIAATVLAFLFRPHIALIFGAAFAISVVMVRHVHWAAKFLLGTASIVALFVFLPTLETSLDVNVASSASVSDFLERVQSSGAMIEEAGTSATNASYPFRLFSLLFRPLFFDANGLLGLVASLENVVMVVIFVFLSRNFRLLWSLSKRLLYLRYAILLLLMLIVSLAAVWYNVGLGLRQRVMYMPALCVAVAAVLAARGAQAAEIGRAKLAAHSTLLNHRLRAS